MPIRQKTKLILERGYLIVIVLFITVISVALSFGLTRQRRLPLLPKPKPSLGYLHAQAEITQGSVTFSTQPATNTPHAASNPSQSQPASLPSATALNPNLPNTPHKQYKYVALATLSEPFASRISQPAGVALATAAPLNPPVTIAVIDTGFALNHELLLSRWANNNNEKGSAVQQGSAPNCTSQSLPLDKSCNNLDNDGNGFKSDWRGWNFVNNNNNPMAGKTNPAGSGVFHGTMTAGLAGYLSQSAKLIPLQALSDDGVGYTDQIAAAVRYAVDNGAKVISMSLGTSYDDPYLHQQIDYAISKGAVVVAAAGNDGCNCLSYPANYPEVLAVGASTNTDTRASFSSYGANLDVLAPGTAGDVCSSTYTAANPINTYSCAYSGTSFATPITAGLAALLLGQYPPLSPDGMISAVVRTANKTAAMTTVPTLGEGFGRINVVSAVGSVTVHQPGGSIVNKHNIHLLNANSQSGPQMNSTCSGFPMAVCDVKLVGPANQVIDLGQKTLATEVRGQYSAEYNWNALSLGLVPGQWKITASQSYYNQVVSSASETINVAW